MRFLFFLPHHPTVICVSPRPGKSPVQCLFELNLPFDQLLALAGTLPLLTFESFDWCG